MPILSNDDVRRLRERWPQRPRRRKRRVDCPSSGATPAFVLKGALHYDDGTRRAIRKGDRQDRVLPPAAAILKAVKIDVAKIQLNSHGVEADLCHHWCPIGRHHWSHKVRNQSTGIDAYLKKCPRCKI